MVFTAGGALTPGVRWSAVAVTVPNGKIPNRGSSGRLTAGLFVVEESRGTSEGLRGCRWSDWWSATEIDGRWHCWVVVDTTVAVWHGRQRWAEAEQCLGGRHGAAGRGWFTAAVTGERRGGGGR